MLPNKENILILISHPSDETLYFYEGIKQLSKFNALDLLCLTYSSTSIRGKELFQIATKLNINVIFKNMSDRGIGSLLYDIEKQVHTALLIKAYTAVITHPANGGEKHHPHHIQCFHIARRLCHQMGLRFGFFSDRTVSLKTNNHSTGCLDFIWELKIFFDYICVHINIRKFPFKNMLEIRKEFSFFLKNIFRKNCFYLFCFHSHIFEKQSALGGYISQIAFLERSNIYLNSIEYLYLEKRF